MCCAVGVPGVCCPMICPPGVRSTCLSGSGNGQACGNRSIQRGVRHLRVAVGREAEPSAAILDSQSIKTSSVRGDARGYDGGKQNSRQATAPARWTPLVCCSWSKCWLPTSRIGKGARSCSRRWSEPSRVSGSCGLIAPIKGPLRTGSKNISLGSVWKSSLIRGLASKAPLLRWGRKWTGIRSFPKAFTSSPEDGSSNARMPGSRTAAGSHAILRAPTPVVRRSSIWR